MDHQAFYRLTQRVSTAGSRRQALRAVLGAALVGVSTTHAAAAARRAPAGHGQTICVDANCPPPPPAIEIPARGGGGGSKAFCCSGTHCSCNGECCNNRCFWEDRVEGTTKTTREFCCNGPDLIICENAKGEDVCCLNAGRNPCATCLSATGISGSYRRP
jgi:hypothetical protein